MSRTETERFADSFVEAMSRSSVALLDESKRLLDKAMQQRKDVAGTADHALKGWETALRRVEVLQNCLLDVRQLVANHPNSKLILSRIDDALFVKQPKEEDPT